ncbi:penicillin-binding transpeptidase domain-containing protein [Patescibacteria group bacterium]|nr:penicillin-binding transpeptidase domain-containing protein [Patescibacteria group bacterium]
MKQDDLNLSDVLTDKYSEEEFLEIPLTDKVFRYFLVVVFLVFLLILGKTFYMGFFQHSFYLDKAVSNISNLEVNVAPRGIINDRFGEALTQNEPSFNVFVSPSGLPKDQNSMDAVLGEASQVLGLDSSSTFSEFNGKSFNPADKLILKGDIDHNELIELASKSLPGIEILPSFKMVDTIPFSFSHLIGYSSLATADDLKNNSNLTPEDSVGRTGLQGYYDSYLRGVDGKNVFLTNAAGQVEGQNAVKEPVQGDTLNTFIDSGLQTYFYNRLSEALGSLGRSIAVGIAMDPRNGEILSLFSIPSYDPNNLADYLNAPNQPIFNRAISGLYSPGSTIKPLDAVGALASHILDPNHEIFSPGYIYVPNPYDPSHPNKFLDWQYQGWVNMYSAIAKSSDVYFYAVGGGYDGQEGLGITRLKEWWQNFLLDKPTGVDLVGEADGFLPDPAWKENVKHSIWRLGDTYNVSIGQGDLLVTPLELLNYVSALANGGILYKPRIVNNIVDDSNHTVFTNQESVLSDLSSAIGEYLPLVKEGMIDTVSKPYGTAYLLHDLPFQVAGKTGSAQVANNTKTNALFVGYAPADNPQIALIVLVENAKEGSSNAVPVAKDVFSWYYENRILKTNSR